MPPQPYPYRASFLATAMVLPPSLEHLALLAAKLLGAVVFDHLIRHPVLTVGDFDDERLTDDDNKLLDARHPDIEDTIDWFFRVNRRDEVLWLDLSLDPDRPAPVRLRARRPRRDAPIDDFTAGPNEMLSAQIAECIDHWLASRRLASAGPVTPFTLADLRDAIGRLDRVLLAVRAADDPAAPRIAPDLLAAPPRLAVAFYRAVGDMSALPARELDLAILRIEPDHPVAGRNEYLHRLRHEQGSRRAVLPIVDDAPMYGKPHLSVWGDEFAADRTDEGMGLRHQGIAATLLPANPYACHNYSLQLSDVFRREESYRWSDRATIGSPAFDNAHLDCVRRLRQVGRPGQAFAEAQYRCNDILERWGQGRVSPFDWPAKYHAGMLLAFVHHDVGRLDEAIRIAEDALADLEDPDGGHESFAWAVRRIEDWRTDPTVLAQAYAWEGYHRGDPGRTVAGFAKSSVDDADDVAMLLDALVALGREDLARVAFHQAWGADGTGIIGDGKARLAGARLEILLGDAGAALEHLQTVQLRRGQSRLEAEINRVLRLASVRPATDWDIAIARRLEQGALQLARMAARDLADFVPGLDTPTVARALGPRRAFDVAPAWIDALRAALPALGGHHRTVDERLALPAESSLVAADRLGREWWTALVPPAKDRDAHAATAVYALGVALARYLALASGAPTPLSGAYRHVATEALHLVRRARYQLDDRAARGLLELVEHCAEHLPGDTWLIDTWLLRIERALDLDTEHGSYLPTLTIALPRVQSLLRGDERIGWELRMAFDLREDRSQHEAAAYLLERCQRAMETGAAAVVWSDIAATSLSAERALDVHWLAAVANPYHGGPWLNLARAQLLLNRVDDAFESLTRGFAPAGPEWRREQLHTISAAWPAAIGVPFAFDAAQTQGMAALQRGDLDGAVRCLRWCEALDPENTVIKRNLGIVLAKLGRVHEAVRAMAGHDKVEAARFVGHAALEAKRHAAAVLAYRTAALRSASADDWRLLAVAAWYAEDDSTAAIAYRRMYEAGGVVEAQGLHAYATALYNTGQWAACEIVARQLVDLATDATYRACGLHALARALCGLGRFGEAVVVARDAVKLNPLPENAAELADTVRWAEAGVVPPFEASREESAERRAFDALAVGNVALPEELAAQGNSWGLFRAALAATELRSDADNHVPVPARALEAALMVLDRSAGNTLPDAVLCRLRALRIRENAFIQIDPPPPLGARLSPDELDRRLAERRQPRPSAPAVHALDQIAAMREGDELLGPDTTPGDPDGYDMGDDNGDPVVFPGQRVARLSDYVAIMKGMQGDDPRVVLSRAGLDEPSYQQVASMWGQRLASDASLHAKFAAMMQN
jgi:tetratricopeptide (TPR) repeat protein